MDELLSLSNDYGLLMKRYKARMYFRDSQCIFEDDVLFRMFLADVPLNEPVMLRWVNKFIRDELNLFREKVSLAIGLCHFIVIWTMQIRSCLRLCLYPSTATQSRFPIIQSRYLRMIPDHTGLLESNEAYVAVGDDSTNCEIAKIGHIVAMRSPSYFPGDVRKLKVVSEADLIMRCATNGVFFKNIVAGLVLSTKGSKSEADMMSGGDFDGDRGEL